MQKYAFKMRLHAGQEAEYRRRHDAIWPELVALLKDAGISDYSIFLDPDTGTLFGVLTRSDGHKMDDLPLSPVMARWWTYMADIMDTHPSHEPVATPLAHVFYMP